MWSLATNGALPTSASKFYLFACFIIYVLKYTDVSEGAFVNNKDIHLNWETKHMSSLGYASKLPHLLSYCSLDRIH